MRFLLYILTLLLLSSCKPTQPVSSQITKEQQKEEPQIGFYYFEAIKSAEATFQVNLTKQKILIGSVKGHFKKVIPTDNLLDKNWLISLSDKHKNNIYQIQIHNPLIQNFEFVNGEGNLERKTIYHDKKEFVIRVPYTNSIKTITFEQLNKNRNKFNTTVIDQISL